MSTVNATLRPTSFRLKPRHWFSWLVFLATLLGLFLPNIAVWYTDYLWAGALGYDSVLLTRMGTSLGLLLGGGLVALLFLWFNWLFIPARILPARLLKRKSGGPNSPEDQVADLFEALQGGAAQAPGSVIDIHRLPRRIFGWLTLVGALTFGVSLGVLVQPYLRLTHGVVFNIGDPIFNLDLSFYLFDLPWWEAILTRALTLVAVATVGAALRYTTTRHLTERSAVAHLSLLGALWLILIGVGRLLERYVLLQSELGAVYGVGYTDLNARIPLYIIEAVLFFSAALILVFNAFTRHGYLLLATGAVWLLVAVLGPLYPMIVQRFTVEPNESLVERPFIEDNIRYTRYAYQLDRITEKDYDGKGTIAATDLPQHADVLDNVRLWDYRPLQRTFSQLQEIRLYYNFNDVDVDRYVLNGQLREVMLAVRELDIEQVAEQAQTWINRHVIFTHGYGLTMCPVNEVGKEGLPNLIVRDLPPISDFPEVQISEPRIYFGESTREYIVVNTTEDEFDYPQGDGNAQTRYNGPDGVPMDGILRRLLLATRFGSLDMLISPALTADSRILFHREIYDRARTIAPMLHYEPDAYPVIADGRIIWILDAYTWANNFPYSEPVTVSGWGRINYLRNSVKVTLDAYTGEINFYLIDAADPIAATYANAFPKLFKPVEQMPAGLRDHWRYPETLFTVQAQRYTAYHMRDPQVFYNREDLWDAPQELVGTEQQVMAPYYVLARNPDAATLNFMLIRPYVPKEKQNMIAWLYADSDGADYGQLGVYKLSKDRMVYGPLQIEGRIDQDPFISQQLTLWNQRGSQVLRGNQLVIPLQDTFLYIEPLYLEAEAGQLPELKRVIVAYDQRVAMAPTFTEALLQVLTGGAPTVDAPTSPDGAPQGDLQSLAEQAWQHYQAGEECLTAGDWECYGREQTALESVLRAMVAPAPGDSQ